MSQYLPRAGAAQARRLLSIISLLGAACLASPLSAQAQIPAPKTPASHHPAQKTAAQKLETLDARIAALHAQLKITSTEEAKWSAVAQTMRDNDAEMQSMIKERRAKYPNGGDALDELKTYEHFSQVHLNGLKNLSSSFKALYSAMPTAQQAVADQVFKHFGQRRRA